MVIEMMMIEGWLISNSFMRVRSLVVHGRSASSVIKFTKFTGMLVWRSRKIQASILLGRGAHCRAVLGHFLKLGASEVLKLCPL